MPYTTAGALNVLINSLNLGVTAYRDRAPAGTALPYVTVTEGLDLTPDALEDGGVGTAVETCQVDLWQHWKDQVTGSVAENGLLAPALIRGLHGKRTQQIGSSTVYTVRVISAPRLLEEENNVVHHPITVEINREI